VIWDRTSSVNLWSHKPNENIISDGSITLSSFHCNAIEHESFCPLPQNRLDFFNVFLLQRFRIDSCEMSARLRVCEGAEEGQALRIWSTLTDSGRIWSTLTDSGRTWSTLWDHLIVARRFGCCLFSCWNPLHGLSRRKFGTPKNQLNLFSLS